MTAGQPTKLTDVVQKMIVEAIAEGVHYETAAVAAGISYATFRHWIRRGEEEKKGKYFKFSEAVAHANAIQEIKKVQQWNRFMEDEIGVVEEYDKDGKLVKSQEKILRYGDYRAIRDFLERRHRDRWGRQPDTPALPPAQQQINVLVTARQIALSLYLADKRLEQRPCVGKAQQLPSSTE